MKESDCLSNPAILEHSEETEVDTEGCLSVPHKYGDVERYKKIKVRYFNGKRDCDGRVRRNECENYSA